MASLLDSFSDPNHQRGRVLPIVRDRRTGERSFGMPQIMADLLSAVMLPGDVYQGNVLLRDPETGQISDEVIKRSADFAGAMTLGAGAIPAEANSLRAGARTYPRDITQTAWTFKDVDHPHKLMERGDWRRVVNAIQDKDYVDVELPIRSMNATQYEVNPDFYARKSGNNDPAFVIKKSGKYFVQDGHHRITAEAAKGKQTANVRLLDLDGTTQEDFPLLDYLQKYGIAALVAGGVISQQQGDELAAQGYPQ